MIPRVVLDTNVVVSALLKPHGLEDQVLRLALAGRLLLCVSPDVLAEYGRVPDSWLPAELNEPPLLWTDPGWRARHALLAAEPQALRQASAERGGRAIADPGHGGPPRAGDSAGEPLGPHQRSP